jgi:putative phosphoesterase
VVLEGRYLYLGVISDSHDNLRALSLVLEELLSSKVDLVVHLGDIISPFVVKRMKEILKETLVIAVRGNNDGDVYQLMMLFSNYGWRLYHDPSIVEIDGRRLLIMHGYNGVEYTENLAKGLAKSINVDVVLFGHTHKALIESVDGKLLVNPGEVCGYLTGKISYAVLDLKSLKGEVVYVRGF